MGGYAPSFNEVNDQTKADLTKAELIAFPILAILLLLVFRGVVAASIPLLIGGISIVGTLFVLRVMSLFVDTSVFALNIATALSLGLAVDYALLMVSRYREEIGRAGASREAHRRTVETAGRTAVFSGLTVAAAMAALAILPQRFLYSMAVAGASVGVLSAVIALLVVPSLLALLGTRIDALSIRRGPAVSDESDGWYRLARWVMRHPVGVALASTGLLLAAATPLLWTTLTGPNSDFVPHNKPAYEANSYVEAHYPRDVTEAVTVTVDGPASRAALFDFNRRVMATDGIARGTPFVRASDQVAYANFALAGPAVSEESQDTVNAIRDLAPPAATTRAGLRQHGRLHRPEAEPRRPPAAADRDHLRDHLRPPLPAHRLGDPAAEDAADERDDARRRVRDRRPLLPGGLARRPLRLHRARRGRGDEPRLPLRDRLRPRHRLRGAGDGPDQRAARPRQEQRGGGRDRASATPAG